MGNLWFEKYRPKELDDMALNEDYLEAFESFIEDDELPHLLFHGPAGSGKTTISLILINNIAANSLNLNASSSDRGVNVIKTSVKSFASSRPREDGRFNVVFFDEADGLTPDAQNALRNTIETYHPNCRFIFTCNNIDKITDAIKSRCQLFQFESIPKSEVISICRKILNKEGISYERRALKSLVERYYPDVRSVINNLQHGSISGRLKKDYLDRFDPQVFIEALEEGKVNVLRKLWSSTVDFTRLYSFLFNSYCETIKNPRDRSETMVIVADYLYKDKTIANREINFTACVLEIMTLFDIGLDFKTTSVDVDKVRRR